MTPPHESVASTEHDDSVLVVCADAICAGFVLAVIIINVKPKRGIFIRLFERKKIRRSEEKKELSGMKNKVRLI